MEQEIREALEKATPGPWRRQRGNVYANEVMVMRLPPSPRFYGGGDSDYLEIRDANSILTTNAPTYLEWCLSQIAELRKENERLENQIERIERAGYV